MFDVGDRHFTSNVYGIVDLRRILAMKYKKNAHEKGTRNEQINISIQSYTLLVISCMIFAYYMVMLLL